MRLSRSVVISAILHQPRLLLLDEPFAGQDWENAEFLMNMIRSVIAEGGDEASRSSAASGAEPRGACLLVTHDSRIVLRGCTRVAFVSDGRVVTDEPLPLAILRLREANLDAYVTDEPAC
jgi:ABC-type multidrug transport system ATPase subunit